MNNESIRYLRKKTGKTESRAAIYYAISPHPAETAALWQWWSIFNDEEIPQRWYHPLSLSGRRGGEGRVYTTCLILKNLPVTSLSLYEVYSIWIDGRTDTYNRPLVGCILYAGTPLFGWGFRHFFLYIYPSLLYGTSCGEGQQSFWYRKWWGRDAGQWNIHHFDTSYSSYSSDTSLSPRAYMPPVVVIYDRFTKSNLLGNICFMKRRRRYQDQGRNNSFNFIPFFYYFLLLSLQRLGIFFLQRVLLLL